MSKEQTSTNLADTFTKTMVLLCRGQFYPRCVCKDVFVVSEDVCWTVNWDPKHTKLVSKGIYDIYCILYCSEIRPKYRCLYQVLPLVEPDYWCLVTEQQYSSLRPSCLGVPSMVFINKKVCRHAITSSHWIFTWDCFTSIPMKLRPVIFMRMVIIYGRVCRVKTQFPLWQRLQVPKYVKRLLKVTNAWHG